MKKTLKITAIKGRPMLQWVGKKPLDRVQYFPPQLDEAVGVDKPPVAPSYKSFVSDHYNLVNSHHKRTT